MGNANANKSQVGINALVETAIRFGIDLNPYIKEDTTVMELDRIFEKLLEGNKAKLDLSNVTIQIMHGKERFVRVVVDYMKLKEISMYKVEDDVDEEEVKRRIVNNKEIGKLEYKEIM